MIGKDELEEAARYNDARAEEFGDLTRIFADLDIDTEAVFHVADQRALRNYAIFTNQLPRLQRVGSLFVRPEHKHIYNSLIMSELDGIAIGAKAAQQEARNDR